MTKPPPSLAPALWQQLQATAHALAQVRAGRSLGTVLPAVPAALRPGVQALSFMVLRRLGLAQALRQQLARRPPPPPADALLCVALALACGDADATADAAAHVVAEASDPHGAQALAAPEGATTDPYEPHTLVDQAVEAAKRDPATQAQAGFLNACLRRYLREREALHAACGHDLSARWNHPGWWIRQLRQDWPTRWQDVLRANNQRAPLVLRVNTAHGSRADWLHALQQAGIEAAPMGEQGVRLRQPLAVQTLPGYAEGAFSVQDSAAQLAAPLLLQGLDLQRPLRVLDACAAPGGKTGHLLELLYGLAGHQVLALDVDEQRCARIRENLQRLQLFDPSRVDVRCADAARTTDWWDGQPFDAILLDAPCTASGIVRRHPDVRWLRRESDVPQLAALARSLLQALWPLLKPGGRLLFCTCSIFLEEGERQMQTFVASNTEARRLPSPGHLMPQSGAWDKGIKDNPKSDQDGFYYALLQRPEAAAPA